jgi:SAM-dependent methyltransferase
LSRLYGEDAELYDIAFDWDVSAEADWLLERLGAGCRSVLEPGCGAGRILEALARRGLAAVGIDRSPAMVELARKRLAAAGLRGEVAVADMTAFDLGCAFDGAVCPINTLAHLTRAELAGHLEAMGAALRPGARYLVQLGLFVGWEPHVSRWEAERDGTRLTATWAPESRDEGRGSELHRSRLEVVAGPRAGELHEEVHELTWWTPAAWGEAVRETPFEWAAVYDGNTPERPRVGFGVEGGLLWHELVRR